MSAVDQAAADASKFDDEAIGLVDALTQAKSVVEYDLDGKILEANKNFLTSLGYQSKDVKAKNNKDFCDPNFADSDAYSDFWMKLAMGQPESQELKRKAKDGSTVWFSSSFLPILGSDGKPYKIVEVASQIEKTDKAQSVVFRKTSGFENSSSAMMVVDRDFIVTEINASTEALMARSADVFATVWPDFDPSNIIGTCIDRFHTKPEHQRTVLSDPSNLPWKTDITIGEFKFALNVSGIFDDTGAYIGNLLEWDDVTEARKNAGILEAIERAQASIDFTPGGQITALNQNMLDLLCVEAGELTEQPASVLVGGVTTARVAQQTFWDELSKGETKEGQFKFRRKDGSDLWVQATFNPIVDGNGDVFKVVHFATDITAQKEAEIVNLR